MLRLATRALALLTLAAIFGASTLPTMAGTTGGVSGHVVDSNSQAPIAGVAVTAVSPTQSVSTTTDASGGFHFLALVPDTYTLQFSKSGYDTISQPGLSVFADQQETITVSMIKSLQTIAKVTSRSASSLVKSGTGSDVYSVNSTVANAAAGLTGPGSLSNAYGAIASVPGVVIDPGEQGWYQSVHIRGGDLDQVGYELDGIPVNRVYDNAPMTMLSSLGQQELQVYTGGTPAGADAQGISGYINQVVRTGTYPGFGTVTGAVGMPTFYHNLSAEVGGSSPDRRFSYYLGFGGSNQDYRYVDGNNGASDSNWFFMPVNAVDYCSFSPGPTGYVYVGGVSNCGGPSGVPLFTTGNAYGIANTQQRDSLINFHFAIPHRNSGLRDDVQFLYLNSEVFANYYSSQDDFSGQPGNAGASIANALGQTQWDDTVTYNGPLMQAPSASNVVPYYFPFSPQNRLNNWISCPPSSLGLPCGPTVALPTSLRDSNENGVSVLKVQYQHAFSANAFLRAYAYGLYSTWEIWGPNTAAQPYYGAELAVYNIWDHTYGGNISFTDQINDNNLLTASTNYVASNLQRYDVGYLRGTYNIANFVNPATQACYDPTSGSQVGCVWQEQNNVGSIGNVYSNELATPTLACTGPCAASAWTTTNDTFYTGSGQALNQVHPRFTGLSIGDEWRPTDRWDINVGARLESYQFVFGDTGSNDPARQFWFTAYNNEYCTSGIGTAPQPRYNSTTGVLGACPAGTTLLAGSANALTNPAPTPYTVSRFQPRLSFTYSVNPDTVIRGSGGVYARPPDSSWVEYDVVQKDLPVYMGNHFAAFGYTTPEHYIKPDTSYNYDLSYEHHFKGTDMSIKVTPFYRSTRDQLQSFFIDPAGGLVSGTNVGNQISDGVELAFSKGDFSKNGLAANLSLTLTDSKIKYKNFPGQNVNVIDQLNNYICQYDGYTQAGTPSGCLNQGVGSQCYPIGGGTGLAAVAGVCPAGSGPNPYYNQTPQGILDRNGSYTTYDILPGPFAGLNGYAVPMVASLIVNYKHDKWQITPTVQFQTGASYGAPTSVGGYDPNSCGGPLLPSGGFDPAQCSGVVFNPNPYNGGHFDTLGQYKQPWVLTGGLGLSYDLSPRMTAKLNVSNLINVCHQRGYAWDNAHTCVYGSLAASLMGAAVPNIPGSFTPNSNMASPLPQQLYPYGVFLNNDNTGFVGATQPLQITGSLQIKL